MFANRNGFYYTLDRTTGKIIVAKPFVTTTWAKEIGSDGRPMLLPGHTPGREGRGHLSRHHRRHELLAARLRSEHAASSSSTRAKSCATYYAWKPEYTPGDRFTGGAAQRVRERDDPVLRRAARHRSGDRRAQVGVQVPESVDGGPAPTTRRA